LISTWAAAANLAHAENIFNLMVENDVVANDDRHYTSGIMLNYVSAIDRGPPWLKSMGQRFPGVERDDAVHVSLSVGHEIYTPQDITQSELIEDDRPYAGYAYIATGFTTTNDAELENWRLSLGIVGPAARAEYIQNTVHENIGSDLAEGWDNQLENEVVVSLAYEKKWRERWDIESPFRRLGMDLMPHVGAEIGTLTNQIRGGVMLRAGQGLEDDYGPPRIRPSLPASHFYTNPDGPSWYFFAGVDARAIVHNIFLDGNNFAESHSVDREPFVAELQTGFVWNTRSFRLALTHVHLSREFEGQGDRNRFGSVSISIHF
jgi:hypothetical protein